MLSSILLLAIFAFSAQAGTTALDVVVNDAMLSSLETTATPYTGVTDALGGAGPLTLFAPDNTAFAALAADNATGAYTSDIASLLSYHVVGASLPAAVLSNDLVLNSLVPTRQLRVNVYSAPFNAAVTVNGVPVTSPDFMAPVSNGVVHKISAKVLNWPTLSVAGAAGATPALSTLLSAVQAASPSIGAALGAAGNLTVFAPTNDAFTALDAELMTLGSSLAAVLANQDVLNMVLQYHVLTTSVFAAALPTAASVTATTMLGETFSITNAASIAAAGGRTAGITGTDILVTNGVVHTIDKVLVPQAVLNALAATTVVPASGASSVAAASAVFAAAFAALL